MTAWLARLRRLPGALVVLALLLQVAALPLAVRAAADATVICHAGDDDGLPVALHGHCGVCQMGVVPILGDVPTIRLPRLAVVDASVPGMAMRFHLGRPRLGFASRAPPTLA